MWIGKTLLVQEIKIHSNQHFGEGNHLHEEYKNWVFFPREKGLLRKPGVCYFVLCGTNPTSRTFKLCRQFQIWQKTWGLNNYELGRFTFFLKKKQKQKPNSGYLQGVIFERKAVPKSCLPNEQKEAQKRSHPWTKQNANEITMIYLSWNYFKGDEKAKYKHIKPKHSEGHLIHTYMCIYKISQP